jgi:hypothetical protein
MNNEEAKLILQAYRPGGQDANDPRFREALAQAQHDPELAGWFANETALDTRISTRLQSAITPPAHLKSQLLAQRKIIRPVAWWQQPAWLTATAAAVVLVAVLAVFSFKPVHAPQFAAFEQTMVRNSLQQTDHVKFASQDLAQIRDWLMARNVATNFDLPAALRDAPVHGCRVIDWHGQKVALLCFMPHGAGHVDLFVIDTTQFPDFTPSATAQFARNDGVTIVSWSRQGKTYLIASKTGEEQLRKIL